jgi:hypothetical protein
MSLCGLCISHANCEPAQLIEIHGGFWWGIAQPGAFGNFFLRERTAWGNKETKSGEQRVHLVWGSLRLRSAASCAKAS